MSKRSILTLLAALLVACASARAEPQVQTAQPTKREPIAVEAANVAFRPAPPGMPKGTELAILEGDPKATGIFTIRLKAPPGFSLAPHTHPVDERVTVLLGSVSVGMGATVDRQKARRFTAGGFYVNPPGVPHFVFSDEGAVVQITGVGPWQVDFLE